MSPRVVCPIWPRVPAPRRAMRRGRSTRQRSCAPQVTSSEQRGLGHNLQDAICNAIYNIFCTLLHLWNPTLQTQRGEHNHRFLKNNQKGTRWCSRLGCAARKHFFPRDVLEWKSEILKHFSPVRRAGMANLKRPSKLGRTMPKRKCSDSRHAI